MFLTRRAYKSISRWLPNEIITEILAASQADQASLCRVSKLFYALCRPLGVSVFTAHGDMLRAFLGHHPALHHLQIDDFFSFHVWPATPAQIPLLHLRHLKCPANLLPAIVASNLKAASLTWSPRDTTDVESFIVALKAMTRADFPFVPLCLRRSHFGHSGFNFPEYSTHEGPPDQNA
ncbi:hypothetical protein DFH09DRAFT_1087283 [Mycena vulgaris]|nr:hypothetical protein DFH09DRAFT_1087283 [Mycena vulgaris]